MSSLPYRKTIKHYDIVGHARGLTFSTYQRQPVLREPTIIRLVLDAIRSGCSKHHFSVLAFVIMPEHVHLLVLPEVQDTGGQATRGTQDRDDELVAPISVLLKSIKRPSSHRIKQLLRDRRDPLLDILTVPNGQDGTAFRFWQQGPGYDRNIRSREGVGKAIGYIHMNPVRRGLCKQPEEWEWSSCRQLVDSSSEVEPWMPIVDQAV
jgi:putative transposase